MTTYECVTYLQTEEADPIVLKRDFIEVDYDCNDRTSFVYTRTREVNVKV